MWEKAEAFCRHDQKVRAAYRFSQLQVAKDGVLKELRDRLKSLGKKLNNLADLMDPEAKLQSQLLDPLADIQEVYRTRYLQAFDEVTGKCEEVRTEIDNLTASPEYQAVAELADIDSLGSIDLATLKSDVAGCKVGLFESTLDRNGVERALKDRPQPEGCPLHVDEAQKCVEAAEQAQDRARGIVRSALVGIANLLRQPAFRNLLQQGEQEPFIAEVLKAPDAEKLADLLADLLADASRRTRQTPNCWRSFSSALWSRSCACRISIPRRGRWRGRTSRRWSGSSASSSKPPWLETAKINLPS